jgi:methylenetetrahydrofolate reductase (NADPH)
MYNIIFLKIGVKMRIIDILKNKRTISFEFFPPKKEETESVLFETIKELKDYNPDFVSVTYGAGGTTTDKTMEWTRCMKEEHGLSTMMHLTSVAANHEKIDDIMDNLKKLKVDNILALRGDLPADMSKDQLSKEFKYANDLVEYIRKTTGDHFSIGVAGYPEKHPQASSMAEDIDNLKRKVDAGGDFIITQLFFDNFYFYDFMDKVRKAGINVPVIAGIMPILNIAQASKFTDMCGASIPKPLFNKMEGKSAEEQFKIGIEYASKQCGGLWESGAEGLHFYTLNKHGATEAILDRIF